MMPSHPIYLQTSIIRNVSSDRHYKISGTFPNLRYFSLATYDTHGMPIDVITDYEVEPKTGR